MYYEKAVQQTIDWLESHLHEPISGKDIVSVSGFSKFHFHRIFQKEVGMSVASYIRLRRLANAAAALLYTDVRIIDIALHYQFESQEAFTRAFKKTYHMPPGAYRTFMKRFTAKKEESWMEKK